MYNCSLKLSSPTGVLECLLGLDLAFSIIRSILGIHAAVTVQLVHVSLFRYSGGKNEDYKLDSLLSHKDSHVICGSEDGRICFWDLVEVCYAVVTEQCFFSYVRMSNDSHHRHACTVGAYSMYNVYHER